MEIYPPTFAKRWGIKKIPPVLDPEDLGLREKNQEFSGKIRNFQEFRTPGGPGGEKNFFPKRPWA